jgi:hypothetical protein
MSKPMRFRQSSTELRAVDDRYITPAIPPAQRRSGQRIVQSRFGVAALGDRLSLVHDVTADT